MQVGSPHTMKHQTEQLEMQSSNQEATGALKKGDVEEERDSESEDESNEVGGGAKKDEPTLDQGTETDSLSRLRREKRLAMNRESARARRKRKKMLIATLEQKVTELTRSNDKFKGENEQMVLQIRGLTERLSNQEEELVLLRALTAQLPDAQFVQQLARSSTQPRVSAAPGSPSRSGMGPGTLPTLSAGIGAPLVGSEEISVRRLLSSQVAGSPNVSAIGNHPGGPYRVPINRPIDQDILGHIGRHSLSVYNQILSGRSNSVPSTGLDAALPSQNTLRVPPAPAFHSPSGLHQPLPSSSALTTSSESSGGASRSLASFNSTDDPRTALILQQLLQERQQQAKGQRFFPR